MLFTRRRFFETTRSPSTASVRTPALFPAIVITDSTPPSQPGTPVGTAVSTSQINWTWTASTDTGGSGLAGYRVYVDGAATPTTTVTSNAYSSTGHSASTTHTLRVEAFDNAGNSISSGTGSQTTQASGGTVTPLYVGTFDTGTVGQSCNTEYSAFNSGSTPVVYSNEVTGPFGEALVGKIQVATGNSYYGGNPRLPRALNSSQGAETWFRAFIRIRSAYCCGGRGTGAPESVNGSLKFWRWFFDGNNRLTLLLGNPNGGSGAFLQGACQNPATSPSLGLFNSEVGTQNLFASPAPVMTRDTWLSICVYILWGANNAGRVRVWHDDVLVINSACSTRPVGSQYDTVAQGFSWPGDYYNGQPQTNEAMGFISQAVILESSSPPPWTDPANGFRYIPKTIDARTL